MKFLILLGLVIVAGVVVGEALPLNPEETLVLSLEQEYQAGDSKRYLREPRQKRVTCDLLSASVKGVTINHSACAAHCLIQRFKGGRCQNGVCHCRH